MVDAAQRSVLFWDVMRQRGNQYQRASGRRPRRTSSTTRPSSSSTAARSSGRSTTRWCASSRRRASRSIRRRRPFVVVDPRAGHGPGIGGFKADSEIGVALQGRPSLLFRRLPARSDARPDHRGHRPRRGDLPRKGDRAASRGRRQAVRDRQLPGRLGGHDAGGDPSRAVRPDHHRRLAAVLLGRRARQESDALHAAACSAAAG